MKGFSEDLTVKFQQFHEHSPKYISIYVARLLYVFFSTGLAYECHFTQNLYLSLLRRIHYKESHEQILVDLSRPLCVVLF